MHDECAFYRKTEYRIYYRYWLWYGNHSFLCMIFNIMNSLKAKDTEKYGLIPTLLQALYSMDPQ